MCGSRLLGVGLYSSLQQEQSRDLCTGAYNHLIFFLLFKTYSAKPSCNSYPQIHPQIIYIYRQSEQYTRYTQHTQHTQQQCVLPFNV